MKSTPLTYTFLSDEEPTDEQLQELMEAALEDVKARAAEANAKFKVLQAQQLQQAMKEFKRKQIQNGWD